MASSVAQPRRVYETASVLFIDIVSYSIQTIDRQTEVLTILQEVVRAAKEFQRAREREELIVLPTGDGMALVFMRDLVSSVRCAVEIADMLHVRTELKIRMGVHIGPVCRHADIKEEINVVGGGINLAQRVMDCGDAGHILLSRNAAEVLSQLDEWHDCLHDLGVHCVKHGVEIHLFNFCKGLVGNAQLPSKLSDKDAVKEGTVVVQERALDVAIAKQVPILLPTELIGLIRMLSSEGLRKVLGEDPDSDLTPEDVRSKPLSIDFLDAKGTLRYFRVVTVRVDAPDFWPPTQSRTIRVPATGDSLTFSFLITPVQLGELKVKLELYIENLTVLSRVIRTTATNSDRIPAEVHQTVMTIPIAVVLPTESIRHLEDLRTPLSGERAVLLLDQLQKQKNPAAQRDPDSGEFTLFGEFPGVVVKGEPRHSRNEDGEAHVSSHPPTGKSVAARWWVHLHLSVIRRPVAVIAVGLALFVLLLVALRWILP
jgi:hypothetical protein